MPKLNLVNYEGKGTRYVISPREFDQLMNIIITASNTNDDRIISLEEASIVSSETFVDTVDRIDDELIDRYKKNETYSQAEITIVVSDLVDTKNKLDLTTLRDSVLHLDGSTYMAPTYVPENEKDLVPLDYFNTQLGKIVAGQLAINMLKYEVLETLTLSEILLGNKKHNHPEYIKLADSIQSFPISDYTLDIRVSL